MTPPNLKQLFGQKYRISYDEACEVRGDPWMMQIKCRGKGITVYPYGEGVLAIEVNHRRYVSADLRRRGLVLHQDGDNEQTFLVPLDRFCEVTEIIKPLRRHPGGDASHLAPFKYQAG